MPDPFVDGEILYCPSLADIIPGDVLIRYWSCGQPAPSGWTWNGDFIYRLAVSVESLSPLPDIRVRRYSG